MVFPFWSVGGWGLFSRSLVPDSWFPIRLPMGIRQDTPKETWEPRRGIWPSRNLQKTIVKDCDTSHKYLISVIIADSHSHSKCRECMKMPWWQYTMALSLLLASIFSWWRYDGGTMFSPLLLLRNRDMIHRIGWWENLQESPIFDGKNHGFL